MQHTTLRRLIGSGILALAFTATSAQAQAAASPATGTQGTTETQTTEDEGGMDLGWLGLLGLAGLLGLRKKDDHHVTRVDTTTGTGSTRTRV